MTYEILEEGPSSQRRTFLGTEPWMEQANCRGLGPKAADIFLPDVGGSTRQGLSICSRCSVRAECLTYALRNRVTMGVMGSTTGRARRKFSQELKERGYDVTHMPEVQLMVLVKGYLDGQEKR